jgi:uncharacterized damage-inducible protein DinB
MDIIQLLLKELEQESAITLKMLQRVPDENWDWKPHQKSMSLKALSVHIAELPSWVSMGLSTNEVDFAATPYTPAEVKNTTDLLELFERSLYQGRTALENAKEEDLLPEWTLRQGEQVLSVMTKYEVIRHSFGQTIHHRAQLGVYLRLLDIPIPGTYGPSADETKE